MSSDEIDSLGLFTVGFKSCRPILWASGIKCL